MKVAITGASGFLGRALVQAVASSGHDVLSLSRKPVPQGWVPYTLDQNPDELPWHGVDAVVHAAFDFSARTWKQTNQLNVRPGIRLFDAATAHGVRRLVLISTLSSFESASSIYGRAKFALERHVLSLGGSVIRPGLVWCHEPGGVFGAMQAMVNLLPALPYPACGPNSIQYMAHREDVANVVVRAVQSPNLGNDPILSVAHPQPWAIRDLLAALAKRSGKQRLLIPLPWPLLYIPLKSLECLPLRIPVRSDSLWGFVHGNPKPELTIQTLGIDLRQFDLVLSATANSQVKITPPVT